MDLNFLLSQEQLAMMRADAAVSSADYGVQDQALHSLRPLIAATGFPHRPYRSLFPAGRGRLSWLGSSQNR